MVPPADAKIPEGAGLMPLRRLNQREYENTVETLFGKRIQLQTRFPDDTRGASGYDTPTSVGSVERDRIEQAAAEVVQSARAEIAALSGCGAGKEPRTCAGEFVTGFGRRVFRRPLQSGESERLLQLFDSLRAEPIAADYAAAIESLVSAMLQSPQFIYHWELGTSAPLVEDGLLKLGGYEVASRLSYFLWADMPDALLLEAAASGELTSAEGVERQARRMLASPDAAHAAIDMLGQWIHIEKLPGLVKQTSVLEVDDALRSAIRESFEAFARHALHERGSYTELLTSRSAFVSAELAPLYALQGNFGSEPRLTELPNERAGLFSQLAFLAIEALPQESSPVRRGKLVAERLLCRTIPPPPAGLNVVPPPVEEGMQTREAYASHSTDPVCAGCHQYMDPLGFAFEHFDAVGRYRELEAGRPIDATGTIFGLDGKDLSFKGSSELLHAIAASAEGQACFVEQVTRYALLRSLGDFDASTRQMAQQAFSQSAFDFRELVPKLVSSKSFRFRIPSPGEIVQ
jgi:hypothetical protein